MSRVKSLFRYLCFASLCLSAVAAGALEPVKSVRLYVLDCGALVFNRPEDYGLKREEVASSNMVVTCYLVMHPKGLLLYDTGLKDGIVGQALWANIADGYAQLKMNTLKGQLEAIGVHPADITYLAVSHSDWDHVGNANDYSGSTWLTPKAERDFMFAPKFPVAERQSFSRLAHAKSVVFDADHDVFGDGTVVLKATPGHTPGHQSLYVKLPKTGGVVLSGDLYHYAEERTLGRMPEEERARGTPQARATMERFLKESHSQLWVGHSIEFFIKARKAPEYYE